MTTCNNTLALMHNVTDDLCVNSAFLIEIMFILKSIKSNFNESYDTPNLHSPKACFINFI